MQEANGLHGQTGREIVQITLGLPCQNSFENVMFPAEEFFRVLTLNLKIRFSHLTAYARTYRPIYDIDITWNP